MGFKITKKKMGRDS